MFPEGFRQRILNQKYIDAEALLKALDETSPVSIRINHLKWNKKPLNSEPVPWCKNGYYLDVRPSYTLDPLFHSGCYYPQEASSMFLEQAIKQITGLKDGIRVLDLCGAPGGKSTHLSDLIGSGNLLVTNDVIRSRASVLAETVTKWGAGNTIVTQNDPSVFGRLPGYFDIILVDAPCSGEGMFRTEIAVNEWSIDNTAHCAERQKRILADVWPALNENGILIYSTCTFNPGENEENIKWLIDRHEADSICLDISEFKGITEIDYQGIYGYGFYPGKIRGEGFFISVIRKTGKQEKSIFRNQKSHKLSPDLDELRVVKEWTQFENEKIIRWGDEVIAIPCEMEDYQNLYQNLKIVKAGTKIFVRKKINYLPSHELALSQHLKKDAFPREEINLSDAVSFLRRDNFSLNNLSKGWNTVAYKDINLGFVNNIGHRLNNYFPVEWRIRFDASALKQATSINWY